MLVREKRFEERLVVAFLLSFWAHIAIFMPAHNNGNITRLDSLRPNIAKGNSTVEVYLVRGEATKKSFQIANPVNDRVEKNGQQIISVPVKKAKSARKLITKKAQLNAQGVSYAPKYNIKPGNAPISASPETKADRGALSREIASLLINQPPSYPTIARLKGWDGTVIVLASVSNDGDVVKTEVIVSSGHAILDDSAMAAVRRWRFKNVESELQVRVPIKFILTEE